MPIKYHRGPLPGKVDGAVYCAPDGDVPWMFSGLPSVPNLRPIPAFKDTGTVVYLEGHRAPDSVLPMLGSLRCDVIIQGDPLAPRPSTCGAIAAELLKVADPGHTSVAMDYGDTIANTLSMAVGDTRILASCVDNAKLAHKYLRGSETTVFTGDAVCDVSTGLRYRVTSPGPLQVGAGHRGHVLLDDGRTVPAYRLVPRVVEHLGCLGSGECDTLVILPDVGSLQAQCAMRRVRSLVLGVGWHPQCHAGVSL